MDEYSLLRKFNSLTGGKLIVDEYELVFDDRSVLAIKYHHDGPSNTNYPRQGLLYFLYQDEFTWSINSADVETKNKEDFNYGYQE